MAHKNCKTRLSKKLTSFFPLMILPLLFDFLWLSNGSSKIGHHFREKGKKWCCWKLTVLLWVQIILIRFKLGFSGLIFTIWTCPKWFGTIEGQGINLSNTVNFQQRQRKQFGADQNNFYQSKIGQGVWHFLTVKVKPKIYFSTVL